MLEHPSSPKRRPYSRYTEAVTDNQRKSLAELQKRFKYARYNAVTEENRAPYFAVSCRPITPKAEDDMELLSDLVGWGETYLDHWEEGVYRCAQCQRALYDSKDKWTGPCVWPSFRRPYGPGAISTAQVLDYNGYTVAVEEVYCGGCDLFIGHQFEDAVNHGDTHPDARWRH
jgi:peptide-methionine (R)-S-oxide reductase